MARIVHGRAFLVAADLERDIAHRVRGLLDHRGDTWKALRHGQGTCRQLHLDGGAVDNDSRERERIRQFLRPLGGTGAVAGGTWSGKVKAVMRRSRLWI